ncbi:hypothetical protein [Bacillus sp. FJAT-49736]|uniref:portal protein n=1 Tax=Bacillus sp. FJAT-49736 TaxID=2833582 RepID=UPI001BC9A56E|nr:hypothetical protein [Bacillus sp. FJAT-49736]MBS4173476.1 hypothetical protein [Bacillus sp. FJAT-49736]
MADSIMEQAGIVNQQYKDGLAYKKQQGYLKNWAEYERFRAGDQWPKATNRTKDLPRPVFNIIDQIQGHKVSSVMNEHIKMVFTPMESAGQQEQPQMDPVTQQPIPVQQDPEAEAADLFTRYAESTWERIKQDDLNEEALDSASNVGTCIWHYYWDTSAQGGKKLAYVGEMQGEIIDPVNFFPGNPQQRDVQKQPYVIITSRDEVTNVQNEAKNNGLSTELVAMITPDSETEDQAYDMAKVELTGSKKVTVLTKYWKENGQVFFMKVAGNVVVKPKTPMNGMKLYPLVVMQWKRRKKSIFGVGDTEGLIPNQKAINFLIAMQIKSAQDTGWPRMLLKKEFIKQNPSNTPGEILVDSGPPGSWNAQYMQPGNIAPQTPALVENIITYTKEVAGANESALGEQTYANMPASAIMMLQKAAGVPIESIKRRFYQAAEDIGRIWEQFWKVYYNTDRLITLKNDNEEPYSAVFNGSQHAETDMTLKIDIGPSSSYSESLMMNSLDKLHDKGEIDTVMYLKYVPNSVAPFKDRLIKELQQRQEQQAMMQQQQMEQQAQMQQAQQQQMMEQQANSQAQAQQQRQEDLALQNKKLDIEAMKAAK